MPARRKLSDEQVKQIDRRVRRGEDLTDLAVEFGVNRKTIWRRRSVLELEEAEREARIAAKRLRRQAERERRRLRERERASSALSSIRSDRETGGRIGARGGPRRLSPYEQWLETPKNLSRRAFAEARGLVRVRNPEGTLCGWRERAEIDALLEAGWLLA